MTKAELLEEWRKAEKVGRKDPEGAHFTADDALLKYIDDAEISAAFPNEHFRKKGPPV